MYNYIVNLRVKYNYPDLRKLQHPPYKHAPIIYGDKGQYSAKDDDIPPLDADGILRVQSIFGSPMFYGWAVDNKILVALSELGKHQAADTPHTNTHQ